VPHADPSRRPTVEARASGTAVVLATVMLGLADVLEPGPRRDLGAEVVDAENDEPELELTFGVLDPLV
jgi:hypothetical protein